MNLKNKKPVALATGLLLLLFCFSVPVHSQEHYSWYDDLYGVFFHLVKGEPEASRAMLQRNYPTEDWARWIADDAVASTYMVDDSDIVIWIRPEWKIGDIVHEAFHAMEFTLTSRGINTGGEAYAYYLDWIVRECLEQLKPKEPKEPEDQGK